jgi:CRISPR-associated endonuclease/helicase Cas3
MGSGLATTTQLEAFRKRLGVGGSVRTVWMSATLQPDWLRSVDFAAEVPNLQRLQLGKEDRESPLLGARLRARKTIRQAHITADGSGKEIAEFVIQHHVPGSLTLIVVNTVDRARGVYQALQAGISHRPTKKRKGQTDLLEGFAAPDLVLIHSRFRPADRARHVERLLSDLPASGRVVVATQVVEAGLDVSARTLITELAPWPSLVQRFGRCNRTGEYDEARVYWIDLKTRGKKDQSPPYASGELDAARQLLRRGAVADVGPDSLQGLLDPLCAAELSALFPYEPNLVLRSKDLVELFDTTPDLAGNDIDVSPFVRGTEDLDVQVFWREIGPDHPPEVGTPEGSSPLRDELCPVPVRVFQDFVQKRRISYRWDPLEARWGRFTSDSIIPGQVFLIAASQGGYDPAKGWSPDSTSPVLERRPSDAIRPDSAPGLIADSGDAIAPPESNDDDRLSESLWQSIAQHSSGVVLAIERICNALGLDPELCAILAVAARWHDRGKAHDVFQGGISDGQPGHPSRPDAWRGRRDLAKAPSTRDGAGTENFWAPGYTRPHFRHELASALAMLEAGLPDLAAYLAAAHHGKVRGSIRSLPEEIRPDDPSRRFARGIWDGDVLQETDLGEGVIAPKVRLDLEVMELGQGTDGQRSWAERVLRLREELGPFRLAYLEALLRAADMVASGASRSRRGSGTDA